METTKKWNEEIIILRSIIDKTNLGQAIKWGAIVYTLNGKNVLSVGAFKNFFTIWFFNGVFLSDDANVLTTAEDGKAKALRQWRFTSKDQINEKLILKYIREAIKNEEEGRVWKPEKSDVPELPDLLKKSLSKNKKLKIAFEKLSPYKQKEYIEHIEAAKKEETKILRLEKAIPMILDGVGLHDKYKY